MRSVIWKHPFRVEDEVNLCLPQDARILTVQLQDGMPTIWFLCDPDARPVNRRLRIYGTGNWIESPKGKYVGTFQNGPFVWHVFDEGE